MVVAIAFACVSPDLIAVRGVVFCPQPKVRFLLPLLRASGNQSLDTFAVEEKGTGSNWIKEHFNFEDPSPSSVKFPAFALKRDFAFARIDKLLVCRDGIGVGFDIFVGPGELALPINDQNETHAAPRAIHGFANIAHYPIFDYEIAYRERTSMSGNAVFCLVEKPDDLLGPDWRPRRNGVFKVVPQDEVGAELLIQPSAHWRKRSMHCTSDTVRSDEIGNPLERGFIFRAGLIVKMLEIRNEQVVGL